MDFSLFNRRDFLLWKQRGYCHYTTRQLPDKIYRSGTYHAGGYNYTPVAHHHTG